ncbi:MAG: hypothetical protein K6G72_06720 [Lachnospiraceae bacterium]|nr:hypothetical protein [Lachnospiraceae bacterium]
MNSKDSSVNETHLAFLQSIIDRMGQNSFHAKEWCVTVVSALVAFYLSQDSRSVRPIAAITAGAVAVLFAVVDAYYLHLERGYRFLYKVVANLVEDETAQPYSMSRPKRMKGFKPLLKALFSISTGLFYLAVIVGIVCLYIFTEVV